MKIYHGSTVCVSNPELLPATRRLDFGSGFYTTSDFQQAKRWAQIKMKRRQTSHAVVSVYDSNEIFATGNLTIKYFETATEEWLDFVMIHRMATVEPEIEYDVIRGPVANDTLYETLALYERHILTRKETIVRLKTHKLADQIVVATPKALTLLRFIGSEEVS